MKDQKAARAMEHIDDGLILSAMEDSDLKGKKENSSIKSNLGWKRWVAIAAAFVVLLSSGIFVRLLAASAGNTIIALDVNPSIEIEINRKEEVIAVHALNEDALIVIGEMELEGCDLEVAMNAIIGSMLKTGYISAEQNSILISIDSKNKENADALKEKLSLEIDALLDATNIDASVITQDYRKGGDEKERAEENSISEAKSELIAKIIRSGLLDANGVPYTYEILAGLRVNELKLILESKAQKVDGIDATGRASDGKYISRDEALQKALSEAGVAQADASRIELEMDFDDDYVAMVYEIEFCANEFRYEYEIKAIDGTVLEVEKKTKDKHDHDDKSIHAPENAISRERAIEIAYADAGVKTENARRTEIELDYEKEICVYEVEFKSAGLEYEYKINAVSGEILNKEVEPID